MQNDSNLDFLKGYLFFDVNTEKMLVGDFWFLVHQKSLQLMQPAIERPHSSVVVGSSIFIYFAITLGKPIFIANNFKHVHCLLSKNFRR